MVRMAGTCAGPDRVVKDAESGRGAQESTRHVDLPEACPRRNLAIAGERPEARQQGEEARRRVEHAEGR
jgi:hypothetical protein